MNYDSPFFFFKLEYLEDSSYDTYDLEGEWIKPPSDGSLDVRFVFGDSRIAFQDWSYMPSYRQSYLNPRSTRSFDGLKLRICKENLKGTGLLIAENFTVTEPDQILLWGPPFLDAKLASGPSAQDAYLYRWGGLNGSTFEKSSGKIDPCRPMMLANTAGNGDKANCRISSSGGVPCIRTLLQEGETYQANSFLNVSYYSTSGSTSNKSMNKEIATQVALANVHHDLKLAIRNQPGSRCNSLQILLPTKTCSQTSS
jgi:hypothetical protein